MDAPKGFVALEKAVLMLDLSRRTVFNMIKAGEIKTKKIRKWRFVPLPEIQKILNG